MAEAAGSGQDSWSKLRQRRMAEPGAGDVARRSAPARTAWRRVTGRRQIEQFTALLAVAGGDPVDVA